MKAIGYTNNGFRPALSMSGTAIIVAVTLIIPVRPTAYWILASDIPAVLKIIPEQKKIFKKTKDYKNY